MVTVPVEVRETEETLEDMRNRLITESRREPEAERRGYINGVLDMYNAAKKLVEKLSRGKPEGQNG